MKKTTILHDIHGNEMTVPVRSAQSVHAPSARYTGFKQEKLLLKKGSIRLKGYMPLPCNIVLERDVPVTLRDGVTIYTDVFRPADEEEHPAILALSPYGKEIGSQWLDDTPNHAGIPMNATSGLQKFEGPDPAYWCHHGYAIINPDVRGAYNSEGVILFFGSDYGRDGADLIEWTATQSWCNGKVAMSGNSWLAISQWFVAAQRPPHLAAIAPWEGLSDCRQEVATRGGVAMPEFVKMLSDSFVSTENGGVEDCIAMMNQGLTNNPYWEDKAAELEKIDVPAYVVASYTNPIHTYGSLEGYRRISSKEKWLRIHNTGEWDDYYNPAHVEDLRKFFDRYLKGIDNGWENTPRVRVSVLNPGGQDIVDRPEADWPIPRTKYQKLYLNAGNHRLETQNGSEAELTYNSDKNGKAVFTMKMPEDTEICGYIKLRLWVEAPDHDDMDLAVTLEKRRPSGLPYKFSLGPGMDMSAKGYIQVSLRELDESRSRSENPVQSMEREQKLKPGEIVPVDILIWPMGLLFKKGDQLRLTVSAYKTKKMWTGPFKLKMAKIELPKEGYTYLPEETPEMVTIGGAEMFGASSGEVETKDMPHDVNRGRHVLHTGGCYDSYLYLPVVPGKENE